MRTLYDMERKRFDNKTLDIVRRLRDLADECEREALRPAKAIGEDV